MRVVWTRRAALGLQSARAYVAARDPAAATRTAMRIVKRADQLGSFPRLGRPGRIPDTFELVVAGTPYIIAYRLSSEQADILAVLHGRQRWPRNL